MKKYSLFIVLLLSSLLGFTQVFFNSSSSSSSSSGFNLYLTPQVSFHFNLTEPTNGNNGAIEARVSGVHENTFIQCFKSNEGGEFNEQVPVNQFFFDFDTEEYVCLVQNLNTGDYRFVVHYEEQSFEEIVHLNSAIQINPLAVDFTTINQKGDNLGQITAVITTGDIEPNEVEVGLKNSNGIVQPFSSSIYNTSNNTLTVVSSDLHAGEYTLTVNDGTFLLEQSTSLSYEVTSLTTTFNVTHVTNDGDAQVTVEIKGGTSGSIVTFNKHGDNTPIEFTSSFSLEGSYMKTLLVSDLSEGVYEVHVSENGLDDYSYVWVGKYGATTTLSFQPDANYGVDACLRFLSRPGYAYLANMNFGNYSRMLVFHGTHGGYSNIGKEVIKFEYNGLESSEIIEAKLKLYGWHHRNQGFGGGLKNEVLVRRIANGISWDENTVTWNTQPISISLNQATISQKGGWTKTNAEYTKTATITDLVKDQLDPANENNGFVLQLAKNYRYRSQYFYSSDYHDPSKRPIFITTFSLPEAKQFAKMKKKLDGGFVKVDSDRKLRFIYKEEYKDLDGNLTYNVYNDQHRIVMTQSDYNIKIDYGQNRETIKFDVCLATGGYYVLEIINEKNEKWYLRFKTEYDLEPNCPGYICPVLNCGVIITGPQN